MTDATTDLKPGDRMEDGTVYAGISPDTGDAMYAAPADAPLTYSFNEAAEYAETLNAQKFLGHEDWRVPTRGELGVLFENRNKGALKGTFNASGSDTAGWYWSSRGNRINAWAQRFSDGQGFGFKYDDSSLRCVRG